VETHKIILQGGGEHARVVLDSLLTLGCEVIAIFDPKYSGDLFGVPQRGVYDPEFEPGSKAVVAIGNNVVRQRAALLTKHSFTNVIHPSVIFSPFASLGVGNMLLQGSIVQAQCKLGNHVIVNTGATVDHDCIIEDFVHIAPGAILCGCVSIGEGSFIGAGSVVIPGKRVGAWATVGAGAVVIQDVPDYAVVVGNPARIIRYDKP
jgi:sugar O-acyltransferase (sialic acid O-acetyltransferase NeuD family)